MKYAMILLLVFIFSLPCYGNEISKSYWFVTKDNGTAEVRAFAPFGAEVAFMDGGGDTLDVLSLLPGEIIQTSLSSIGYPQGELFGFHVEANNYIYCWLFQPNFDTTMRLMLYPVLYNTFVYSSGSGVGGNTSDDYFWIYSKDTQLIRFLDNNLGLIDTKVMLAGETASLNVQSDFGITSTPYAVIILGQEPFATVFHDAPNITGGIQAFNR